MSNRIHIWIRSSWSASKIFLLDKLTYCDDLEAHGNQSWITNTLKISTWRRGAQIWKKHFSTIQNVKCFGDFFFEISSLYIHWNIYTHRKEGEFYLSYKDNILYTYKTRINLLRKWWSICIKNQLDKLCVSFNVV